MSAPLAGIAGNNMVSTTSYVVAVGELIQVSLHDEYGWYANTSDVYFNGEFKTLVNGYLLSDESLGTLTAVPGGEAAITYAHERYGAQEIWFFGSNGETAVVNLMGVPIHDHSSIHQGGPAYGTYSHNITEEGA